MEYIKLPSTLMEFSNYATELAVTACGREEYVIYGTLERGESVTVCPCCGSKMHIHSTRQVELRHLPFGHRLSVVRFDRHRYYCPSCQHSEMEKILFKAENHRMTTDLLEYTQELLREGLTNKEVSEISGLGQNTIKEIDTQRLQQLYTELDENGKRKLKGPEQQARFLGIDEFKLHNGYKYATVIVDLETMHILWLAHGRKKACVYNFIEHVGLEWMDGVHAIACDMNSDYQEAFEETCPHLQPVFDYFHIIKNFNDKVIGAVRRDEQRRLSEEGNSRAADALKKTKYILTSSRDTLAHKDKEAEAGVVIERGAELFQKPEVTRKVGYLAKYQELLQQNQLLFTLDIIKEKLSAAYQMTDELAMTKEISDIMDLCEATGNKHLKWFGRLISNHFEGIVAHAAYSISTSKLEGLNNKIKTIRRQAYGYPDDDYFFLKLFDASRRKSKSKS